MLPSFVNSHKIFAGNLWCGVSVTFLKGRTLNKHERSIPLECVPSACADRNFFNGHQMSLFSGRSKGGAPGARPLQPKIFAISCSFLEYFGKIVSWRPQQEVGLKHVLCWKSVNIKSIPKLTRNFPT